MLASALAIVPATPARAQDEQPQQVDEIRVTGSRIVRQDFEANAPITTIDRSTFENTSTIGVETVLNQLPQFVPAVTQFDTGDVQTTVNNTVGASLVSLRGLGANRNLVLIDGRRAQPVNPTMVVDTNMIPSAAIQRVEIISGGASAVYGADAVGGVVNFILKDDFEGASVEARIGDTQHGGNQEVTLSALLGAALADDRGHVMLGIERDTRSKQYAWERDWRVEDYANPNVNGTAFFPTETWITNNQNGTSFNSPNQDFVNAMFDQAAPCPAVRPFGEQCPDNSVPNTSRFYLNRTQDGTGTVFTGLQTGTGAAGAYRYTGPFDHDPYGNFQGLPFRKIQPDGRIGENSFWSWTSTPLERLSSFANADFDISDSVKVTSQALFSRTHTETSLGLTSDAIGVWGAPIPFGTTLYQPSVVDALGPDGQPGTGDEDLNTLLDYQAGGRYGLDCPALGGCTESQAFPMPQEIVDLFMTRPNPEADIFVNRPLDFLREQSGTARSGDNVTTTMQLSLGLEGELPSGNDFWDVTVSTGHTDNVVSLGGAARLNSWRALVGSPNFGMGFQQDANEFATGFAEGIATCRTGLPIVRDFLPSQDCIDLLSANLKNSNQVEQTVVEANVYGDLAEMPAGPLGYAMGVTYREDSFTFKTDNLTKNESFTDSIMGLFPQADSSGEFDVSEIYGELLIPIVSNGPTGVEHFNLELGGRVSDWNTVGSLTSYKGMIDWGFTPNFRLRGGVNLAHRAPNLAELFQSRTQLFGGADGIYGDQCSQNNEVGPFSANAAVNVNGAEGAAFTEALCRALMGTAGAAEYYDNRALDEQPDGVSFFEDGQGIPNTTGNPNLHEEEANTFTLGLVMRPFDDWTFSVDYYTIEIEDMIAVESGDAVFERCLSPAFNPTGNPNNPDCLSMIRNPTSGEAANLDLTYTNQGRAKVTGLDLQLDWSKQFAVGGFGLNMVANYNLGSETQETPDQGTTDWAGTDGCALQLQCQGYDYRIFTTLNYFRGPWSLSLRHQFWPSILDDSFAEGAVGEVNPNGGVHESYQLFSLSGSYRIGDRYTVRVGIQNLFDKEPPLAGGDPDNTPYPTAPTHRNAFGAGATYDPLGRQGFVSMTMDF